MAINMEWAIPKDGVVWAAKYSSSGLRRFSTLGLGLNFSLNPSAPPKFAPASNKPAELISVLLDSGNGRVKSAPAELRSHHQRSKSGHERRGRATGVDCNKHSQRTVTDNDTVPRSAWGNRPCVEGRDLHRAHSAASCVTRNSRSGHEHKRFAPAKRVQSAWSRLVSDVVPDEIPKPLWGEVIDVISASNAQAESLIFRPPTPRSQPTISPRPPAYVSRPVSAATEEPSATSRPSSGGTPRPRSNVKFAASELEPSWCDEVAEGLVKYEEELENFPEKDLSDAYDQCFPSLDSSRMTTPVSRPSSSGSARTSSRPVSAVYRDLDSRCSATSRLDTSRSGSREEKCNRVTATPVFCNELWYRKGHKILASQRTTTQSKPTDPDPIENDPEFVAQRLSRPTASSRNRQVHQAMAQKQTIPNHSNNSHKKQVVFSNVLIHPNRFKGTHSVTSAELRQIVDRLSACDPTQVPNSGRSRCKGKGFSGAAGYRFVTASASEYRPRAAIHGGV